MRQGSSSFHLHDWGHERFTQSRVGRPPAVVGGLVERETKRLCGGFLEFVLIPVGLVDHALV